MTAVRARRCETCSWWQRHAPALSAAAREPVAEATPDLGACQIGPPVVNESGPFGAMIGVWPQTRAHRFCGEWEALGEPGGPDDGEHAPTVVPLRSAAA